MSPEDFRVSVVITSYNQRDYLIEAIESVINQTISPHEIIVADDCSTDESTELIRDYVAHHPGLIKGVFQKKNVGIPKNRNTALHQVTGKWVAILDGDDRFLPCKLEKEMEALQNYPTARCVYSNVAFIDNKGQFMGKVRDREEQPSGDIFSYIALGKFGILRSMVIDYALIKDIGFLDERFPSYDGYELTIRLAKRCHFVYVSEPLVEYRFHDASYQKGLKTKKQLHELEAIYEKMAPLMSNLSGATRNQIISSWGRRLFQLRVRDAIECENKAKVFITTLSALANGYANRGDLRQITAMLTPEPIRRIIRQLRTQSNWRE
jgi:glycosyltransferase involved in cell wall biosynthesis